MNGNGGAAPPVNGGFDVYELFGEALVPLISDMPYAKDVSLELGVPLVGLLLDRQHQHLQSGWRMGSGRCFLLRAGYNRAVRAPNVQELFAPLTVILDGNADPCAGLATNAAANAAKIATCANIFDLTSAQVLTIEANPANQYNGQIGGSANLKPEISDTYTAGVVLQPKFLPGFTASIDYFNICINQFISRIGATLELNQCVNNSNQFFCNLVQRDANGSLFLSNRGFVQDPTQNTGTLKTTGLDLNVAYHTDLSSLGLGDNGSISASMVGTWLNELNTQPVPGGPPYNCKSLTVLPAASRLRNGDTRPG